MVPLTSLGVRPVGSGYMLDRDKSSKTLPHELVHQLTPDRYYAPGSMGWFTEGIAEYVATTPYRSGSYNVKTELQAHRRIRHRLREGRQRRPRARRPRSTSGSLEKFMLQPYSSFTSDAQINYGCGLLITNYFLHMDRDGGRRANQEIPQSAPRRKSRPGGHRRPARRPDLRGNGRGDPQGLLAQGR